MNRVLALALFTSAPTGAYTRQLPITPARRVPPPSSGMSMIIIGATKYGSGRARNFGARA